MLSGVQDRILRNSIHQWIECQVSQSPDVVAITFQGQNLTYRELNQKANQLAHHLISLGVGPESLVGICIERSLDMFISLLGVLKAGGAYIPLDPNYPQERLAFILTDAKASILITQKSLAPSLPEHQAHTLYIDAEQSQTQITACCETNPEQDVLPHHLAYMIYTSGSTGTPKGVQISHGSLINLLQSMQQEPGMSADDTLLAITTFSFDLSVPDLYLPLVTGAKIRLIERSIATDSSRLAEILSEPDVTFVQATPATWRLVLAAGWKGNSSLKVLCGGEALTRSLANQLLEKVGSLWHMYGPTETTVWSMVHRVEPGERAVPLGKPVANTQIYLVKTTSQRTTDSPELIAPGEEGEIYIGGQGVARGYRNRPELTQERFIRDPFSSDPNARLYKTGDLARLLHDGTTEIVGRIDNQVKIRGYRIELGDIEAVLSQHAAVTESAVIPVEDESGNRRLVAYVVLHADHANLRAAQLRVWLKEKLPDYMVPSIVVFMDALPLTPNRKIDRRALPAPTLDCQEEVIAPGTELEKQLVNIWSSVLGLEVGIYHNFFESGGDSLRTALLLARVRETLRVELSLDCLFKAPTVASFAEVVESIRISGSNDEFKTTTTELWEDSKLDESIRPSSQEVKSSTERIFLTGATGFIGAFLLEELLLKEANSSIYCLVRAESLEQASNRLRQTLQNYEIWQDSFGSRIIPVVGDLSKPLLGLSEQKFQELADRIDVIYHSGAYVNLIYPYSALRSTNVQGTQEVLRLATQAQAVPLHYISTLDVFHTATYDNEDLLFESDNLSSAEGYSDGYAQSKWVAEKLVMEARERGLPVCIYRLGMITGHSKTGGFQLGNIICRMIKGFIQMGSAPDLEIEMALLPVDTTVKAIASLSRQVQSYGKTFHIDSPHRVSIQELVRLINQQGYSVKLLPYSNWQTQLISVPPENALTPAASMFMRDTTTYTTPLEIAPFVIHEFDTTNAKTGLSGADLAFPQIDASVLEAYIGYFLRRNFLEVADFYSSTSWAKKSRETLEATN